MIVTQLATEAFPTPDLTGLSTNFDARIEDSGFPVPDDCVHGGSGRRTASKPAPAIVGRRRPFCRDTRISGIACSVRFGHLDLEFWAATGRPWGRFDAVLFEDVSDRAVGNFVAEISQCALNSIVAPSGGFPGKL